MKVLLDTCVLYPTVMRQVLLGAAGTGCFTPFWSARILEEWRRAAVKLGPAGVLQAESEISVLRTQWPKAELQVPDGLERRLWLPDPNDIHMLAAAIAGSTDLIVTLNARDFPRGTLAEEGLARIDPDALMLDCLGRCHDDIAHAVEVVRLEAERLSGREWPIRALLKKARLPRLGKALS